MNYENNLDDRRINYTTRSTLPSDGHNREGSFISSTVVHTTKLKWRNEELNSV